MADELERRVEEEEDFDAALAELRSTQYSYGFAKRYVDSIEDEAEKLRARARLSEGQHKFLSAENLIIHSFVGRDWALKDLPSRRRKADAGEAEGQASRTPSTGNSETA